jgi:hypothetical protein
MLDNPFWFCIVFILRKRGQLVRSFWSTISEMLPLQYIYCPLDQDAGKLLLCRAVDQQTGEGGKEDGWKLNINCKFKLQILSDIFKYFPMA